MVGLAQLVAVAVALAAAAWILGGVVLRLTGWGLAAAGVVVAVTAAGAGRAWLGLALVAAGTVVWLTGQVHYAARHHAYASPLARRLFLRTPLRRVDPAARWRHGQAEPLSTTTPIGTGGPDESAWPSPTRARRRAMIRRDAAKRCRPPA